MNYKQVQWWQKKTNLFLIFIFSFYLTISTQFKQVKAQSNQATPTELIELITKIDLAANKQDLESLSQYISPQFQTNDGLDYQGFTESLKKLWQQYPNLQYKTRIESWESQGEELIAITLTETQGYFESEERKMQLLSNIKAKHHFQAGKLVKQEILQEKTEITSGENPPEIVINLPETAKPGSQFDFDVIVTEPLGNDLLLGGAIEKEVNQELYKTKSEALELDALAAGGIFKRVTIPLTSGDRLYSVLLIREDGLRLVTQRVKIQN